MGIASRPKKDRINEVRIYLRVITIVDLVFETGTYIPGKMLCGEWRAGSDLKWSKATRPGKKAWAEFRKYTRAALSLGTNPYQSTSNSIVLGK